MRRMESSNYYRLGAVLGKLRRTRGIKQLAVAAAAGITEARVNKLERGKVVGPGRDAVQRISSAMQLSEVEARELNQAAAHDRCMREVARNFSRPHQLALIATALDVVRVNSQEDCEALAKAMHRLARGRQGVNAFNQQVEETAMT